jgi:hypothetical protein
LKAVLSGLFAHVEYPWKLVSVDVQIGSPNAKGTLNEERAKQMWERYQALYDSLRNPLRD